VRQPEVRCIEFVEQVTEWLDGGLRDDERLLFEEHLAYCSPCEQYVAQFRQTLALLRAASGDGAPGVTGDASPEPSVREALLSAFRQRRP
jgi:anti-sigma factor RsiW